MKTKKETTKLSIDVNWDSFIKLLPAILLVLLMTAFVILTLLAVVPRADSETKAEGQKNLDEINITFNKKTLDNLSGGGVNTSTFSGRNPFAN
jgi:hypothetical protein